MSIDLTDLLKEKYQELIDIFYSKETLVVDEFLKDSSIPELHHFATKAERDGYTKLRNKLVTLINNEFRSLIPEYCYKQIVEYDDEATNIHRDLITHFIKFNIKLDLFLEVRRIVLKRYSVGHYYNDVWFSKKILTAEDGRYSFADLKKSYEKVYLIVRELKKQKRPDKYRLGQEHKTMEILLRAILEREGSNVYLKRFFRQQKEIKNERLVSLVGQKIKQQESKS
jgi:hypothetical protein